MPNDRQKIEEFIEECIGSLNRAYNNEESIGKEELINSLKSINRDGLDYSSYSRFKGMVEQVIDSYKKMDDRNFSDEHSVIIKKLKVLEMEFEEKYNSYQKEEFGNENYKDDTQKEKDPSKKEFDLQKAIKEEEAIIMKIEAKIQEEELFKDGDVAVLNEQLKEHLDKKAEMETTFKLGVEKAKEYKENSLMAVSNALESREQFRIIDAPSSKGDIKFAQFNSPINEKAWIAFSQKAHINIANKRLNDNAMIIDNDENVYYITKKELPALGEILNTHKKRINQFDIEGQEELEKANQEHETIKEVSLFE